MIDDECTNATVEEFEACTGPVLLPAMSTDTTQFQRAVTKEQNKKQLELFKEQRFAERSLKSKIINVFDQIYLLDIKEDRIGCSNVSMPDVLKHLFKWWSVECIRSVMRSCYENTLMPSD